MDGRLDRILRRIVTAAGVGLVVLLVSTAAVYLSPGLRGRLLPDGSGYRIGERIDLAPQTYANARLTIVMFARSSCKACQEAKPILTRMAAVASKTQGVEVKIVSPVEAAVDSEIAYAAEMGLGASSVVQVRLGTVRARSVPSIVVVNRQGQVLYVNDRGNIVEAEAAVLRLTAG